MIEIIRKIRELVSKMLVFKMKSKQIPEKERSQIRTATWATDPHSRHTNFEAHPQYTKIKRAHQDLFCPGILPFWKHQERELHSFEEYEAYLHMEYNSMDDMEVANGDLLIYRLNQSEFDKWFSSSNSESNYKRRPILSRNSFRMEVEDDLIVRAGKSIENIAWTKTYEVYDKDGNLIKPWRVTRPNPQDTEKVKSLYKAGKQIFLLRPTPYNDFEKSKKFMQRKYQFMILNKLFEIGLPGDPNTNKLLDKWSLKLLYGVHDEFLDQSRLLLENEYHIVLHDSEYFHLERITTINPEFKEYSQELKKLYEEIYMKI